MGDTQLEHRSHVDNGSADPVGSAAQPGLNSIMWVVEDVLGIRFTQLIQMAITRVRAMEPYLGSEEDFGGNCGGTRGAVPECSHDRSGNLGELTERERARDGDVLPKCHGVALNKSRFAVESDREMGNSLNAGVDGCNFVRPELSGLACMGIATQDSAEDFVFRGLLVRHLHAGFLHNVIEVLHRGYHLGLSLVDSHAEVINHFLHSSACDVQCGQVLGANAEIINVA
eukprot:6490236-Amphidinium_carterae.1